MDLKLSQGTEKPEELFSAAQVTELVDPKRANLGLTQTSFFSVPLCLRGELRF
jgi:hypothetical protein